MDIEALQAKVLDLQTKLEAANNTISSNNELLEGFKTREENYKTKEADYQEKIWKLRDMNSELFLRTSQPVPTESNTSEVIKEETKITLNDILG